MRYYNVKLYGIVKRNNFTMLQTKDGGVSVGAQC